MRLVYFLIPILGSTLLMSGCATLNKQQCIVGDWQSIGYNDGVAGHYADRLAAHSKACAIAGVSPDYLAWERGRQLGLKQYCTVTHAYALGRQGRQLNDVCPSAMMTTLYHVNAQGREYYTLSNQLTAEQHQLKKYQDEFERLRQGERLNFNTEKEARARLLILPAKIDNVRRRIANAESRLRLLERLSSHNHY